MNELKEFIEKNKDRFLAELFDLLRIPSVSAQSSHKDDMERAARWLSEAMLRSGASRAQVMPTEGNPIVYGESRVDRDAPTVLVYGHYDVMPAEPLEEWRTDPFEPVVREGRIWGRGADDDKGQLYMHLKAMEALRATVGQPCNLKFMLEGEEEIGSPSMYRWCEQNKELLRADVILVSDTSMIGWDTPSITVGLRGLCYVQVEVTGPDKDLHSGLYGGAVVNPATALASMITHLTDADGRVTIPGFYDGVKEFSAEERRNLNAAPFDESEYRRGIGVEALGGESGYTVPERTGIRPALDVNGIWSGYTGEGSKTIVPSKANAKISMRLVPGQDWRRIGRLFAEYFPTLAPRGVRVKVQVLHGGQPYVTPTDMPAYRAAVAAVEDTFGRVPLPFYSGGSIPIVSGFENILGLKSLLLGFGLGRDAIHSPNESYGLENFYRGIETIAQFHRHFAAFSR